MLSLDMLKLKKKRYKNKNKPKIIFDKDHFLIYSSRNPLPLVQKIIIKDFIRIWAYCYPRDKLIAFSKNGRKHF